MRLRFFDHLTFLHQTGALRTQRPMFHQSAGTSHEVLREDALPIRALRIVVIDRFTMTLGIPWSYLHLFLGLRVTENNFT